VAEVWQTPLFRALEEPVTRLVGDRTGKAFEALGIRTVHDVLRHLPRHLMSGTETTDLSQLMADFRRGVVDDYVAVVARVDSVRQKGEAPRLRLEVRLTDGTGYLDVTFFGKKHAIDYWQKLLSRPGRGIFAGKLSSFRDSPQLAHPAFVIETENGLVGSAESQRVARQVTRSTYVGLYPQSAKLPTWTISECAELAIEHVAGLDDALPEWVRDEADVVDFETACRAVHIPTSREEHAAGRRRLIFDEAFATQVAMAYRRQDARLHRARAWQRRTGGLLDAFDGRLPFPLTEQQVAVSDELFADLARTRPMQRLLQGEVGSGKTVVALRAMLAVVEAGGQAVLLAPTEVLAQQHAATVRALLGDLGAGATLGAPDNATDVVLLTGSTPAAQRREVLDKIASGEAGIIIGTHALLEQRVEFAELGLVVVDEQHRFGVEQRNALGSRAEQHPHVLVMTATPIPRSVAMTVFGDLEVSTITELPLGRADVSTTVVDQVARPAWVERAWQRIAEEAAQGRQAFVITPRIGTKDDSTGASVEETYERLSSGPLAALRVAMLHGRLPADEKADVMRRFAAGELDVLVATTVVEVGVDVPNATMMVVCDAESFGISQLHQLRGRIGRGSHPGVCLLVTSAAVGTSARERLDAVASTRDGFVLSEVDLAQRREGDVLGRSQAGGRSSLRLLRVLDHAEDIAIARSLADKVVERDPDLTDPGVRDYVRQVELLAEGEWQEAT
jgi:ATP-dependent DNA helicase RecG